MAGSTNHFNLSKLGAGDQFSDSSYKYTGADREVIDSLLYLGASGHHHTGEVSANAAPSTAPSLELDTTVGIIPAGTRAYYKYTLVDQYGHESAPSPEAYVDTPSALSTPAAGVLTLTATGGTLLPGQYFYVLSAYEDTSTQETRALNPAFITVLSGSTNKITITLPSLPSGADGFNIYRKAPGDSQYLFLDSVDMTGATPPTTYVDDGVEEDCNRTLPTSNTTNASNAVIVSYPGTTPTIPTGYTWKIYRTYTNGVWTNSLVHHVVEETSEGSGIITTEYEDLGYGTTTGEPPSSTLGVNAPEKIDMTDAAEVQGTLPPGLVAAFPMQIDLRVAGEYTTGTLKAFWVCEYPNFEIVKCRVSHKYAGAATSTIVDVNLGATPGAATTIYSTQANRPSVAAGSTIGTATIPDTVLVSQDDVLTVDIDQDGGGATPTHEDLLVTIYGWVTMASESSDPDWE